MKQIEAFSGYLIDMRKSYYFRKRRVRLEKKLSYLELLYIRNALEEAGKDALETEITVNIYEGISKPLKKEFNRRIREFIEKYLVKNRKDGSSDNEEGSVYERKRSYTYIFDGFEEVVRYSNYEIDYREIQDRILSASKIIQKEFLELILGIIENALENEILDKETKEAQKAFDEKIHQIVKFLNLTELEKDVLVLVYYINSNPLIDELFKILVGKLEVIKALCVFLDTDENKVKSILQRKSRLLLYDVIFIEADDISLNEEIYDFIEDLSSLDFTERFFSVLDPENPDHRKDILDLKFFSFYQSKIEIIKKLLVSQGKTNILFHGKAGTGKTTLAKSIIASLGKKIVMVSNRNILNTGYMSKKFRDEFSGSRTTNLIMACHYAKDNNGIVVMDEADEFLNSHISFIDFLFPSSKRSFNVQKNWINDFLDTSEYKIIWITNYTDFMDESVKRRFDYTVYFSIFNGEAREYIVSQLLEKYKLHDKIGVGDLQEYFLDSSIPIGMIENTLKQISQILSVEPGYGKQKIISIAREIFDSNYEFIYDKNFSSERKRISETYKPEYLHTSPPVMEIINKVKNFANRNKNKEKNYNLLFYGPSGTGKTELAKYIIRNLNYRVIELTPSNVLSPYFGVTEKVIKYYFKQASSGNTVLLIDEMEAFFSEDTQDSILTQSITAEFLQQLEEFKGILIGTTNFIDKISPRISRRFHLKVEFFPLEKEKIPDIFLDFFRDFLPLPELGDDEKQQLLTLEGITIGDFQAVKRAIEFDGEMYFNQIFKLLREELFYRLHKRKK